jgi:hypothetical protein
MGTQKFACNVKTGMPTRPWTLLKVMCNPHRLPKSRTLPSRG